MLRLRTFGGLSIENGNSDTSATARRRPLALLALLAVAGESGLRREKLISLLWPESDEERGSNSLSQALTWLRREWQRDVVIGAAELRLNAAVMTSDVREFEDGIAAAELERAVELYRGAFLDGFFLNAAPDFERWTETHRQRLHHLQIDALERLARQAGTRGDVAKATHWWRRLTALDPTSTSAALGLMEALAASGDRAAALQFYGTHEAIVKRELGIEPEDSVRTLAARLRNGGSVVQASQPVPNDSRTSDRAPTTMASNAAGAASESVTGVRDSDGALTRVRARDRRIVRLSVLAGLVGSAIVMMVLSPNDRARHNPRQVVVTGFANRTGDSTLNAFGFLVADFITDALQRSGLAEVTDPATSLIAVTGIRESVPLGDERKERQLVADATHAGLVVSGWYTREGDSLVITARVSDALKGKLIAATEPVRGSTSSPSNALETVRQRVLGILAVRLDDRLAFVLPPGSTALPTLAAYREYVDGLLQFRRSAYDSALRRFQQAYELDTTFVAPLVWQVFAYEHPVRRDTEWRQAIQRLAMRRDRLGPVDRHVLESFEAHARGDIQGDAAALDRASNLAPGSIWTFNLGGVLWQAGRYREAAAALSKIDRTHGWTRDWPDFWNTFVVALHYVDHDRELEIAREARRALPPNAKLVMNEARALVSLGRRNDARKVIAQMRTAPDDRLCYGNYLRLLGNELWGHGDTVYAQNLLDSAVAWVRALPDVDKKRCGIRWQLAFTLYDAGDWKEALPLFERIVADHPEDWEAVTFLGLCYARYGQRERAEAAISRLLAASDKTGGWTLTDAARIAAVMGHRERVIQFLEELRDRGRRQMYAHLQARDYQAIRGFAAHKNFVGLLDNLQRERNIAATK